MITGKCKGAQLPFCVYLIVESVLVNGVLEQILHFARAINYMKWYYQIGQVHDM